MRFCLVAAALLLALPAAAQDRAPPPDQQKAPAGDEIVVTGKLPTNDQISTYVRGMTGDPGTDFDPLARFDRYAMCPEAVGLTPEYDAAITARMRRVAAAAKIKLAPETCKPNVIVIFAEDKDDMVAALRKSYPVLFRQPTGEMVRVPRRPGPAVAWHLTGFVDRTGLPLSHDGNMYILETPNSPSRLVANVRPIYFASVVVIERGALEGLTTIQVADYAAMRAYTASDPARVGKTGAPTILTVLEAPMGSETPASLTVWDLAFIRALYAVPENNFARRQRSDIGRRIKREVGGGGASPPKR